LSLAEKSALVTGSTSGIGLGIALGLAREGANIMLNGFGDQAAIEKIKADIAALGVKVEYDAADMTKPDQIAEIVAKTESAFGSLDILINNAGVQHVAPIESFPAAKWEFIIALNLSSSFYTMQAAIPGMKARKWGRIINIASAHGLVASPQKAGYVAAKHGLVGLTKVAALELASFGITANAICPGWVLTPLVETQLAARAAQEGRTVADVTHEFVAEKQPLAEFTTTDHIAGMVVFLCSDNAKTITGAPLSIDGGWVAQ
jgi:3-hydroxybutyrate dehydrogenase